MGLKVLIEGIFIGSITLLAYTIGMKQGAATARTMCFAVLGLSQISHAFNSRSDYSLSQIGLLSNPKLLISAVICITLQLIVICLPVLGAIFETVALNPNEWGIVAILSLLPIPVVELQKRIR